MQSIQSINLRLEQIASANLPSSPVYEERNCELHGPFQARHLVRTRWSTCPECRRIAEAKEEAERVEAIRKAKEAALWATIGRAGIPDRFMDRTFDSFKADSADKQSALAFATEFADNFPAAMKTGRSAIFLGRPGTGKTHLACAIGKRAIARHNASVLFITVMRAMRSIKDTWAKGSEVSESQAIAALVEPDLLILDEVGVQFGSDFERNTMFDVLNERYERRKPTLFLSNLTKQELTTFLGERVMDRLREDGGCVIPFAWESQRGKVSAP